MTLCPCGSGLDVENCCKPIIAGTPASTAEALLRSRYTAFTQGNIGYLADTLGPEISDDFDQVEAGNIAMKAKWQGLEVRTITDGGKDDETGSIEFIARFRLNDQPRVHHEISEFRREQGRWMCVGGKMDPKEPPRHSVKVGRNEPCPCGSGKKFKKCCGS